MDLAATPSQLSSSVWAVGGCKGCSLPAPCCETAFLSQTLRLKSGQGSERASSSAFSKFTATQIATGGSNLHTQKTLPCHHWLLKANTWHCNISCWATFSLLNCGSKASKGKKIPKTFPCVWNLGTTLLASFNYRPALGISKPAPCD